MSEYLSHLQMKNSFLNFEASIPAHCNLQTQYVYKSSVHSGNLLSSLNDQRKKGLLCDITVIVEGVRIPAHKSVLAACSTYFNSLITSPENISHNIVLELSTVSRVAMESLLEFAYTSQLTVSSKNISQILDAVRELDIKNIEFTCLNVLKEKLLSSESTTKISTVEASNVTTRASHPISTNNRGRHQVQPAEVPEKFTTISSASEQRASVPSTTTTPRQVRSEPQKMPQSNGHCPAFAGLSLTQRNKEQTTPLQFAHSCSLGPESCCMRSTESHNKKQSTSSSFNKTNPAQHTVSTAPTVPHPQTQIPVPRPYCPLLSSEVSMGNSFLARMQNEEKQLEVNDDVTTATCVSFSPIDTNEPTDTNIKERQTKINQVLMPASNESPSSSSLCQRSKRTSSLNIVLPFSFEQITKLPRSNLQELLNKHPNLTQKQLNTIHELRRRGKNRIAAQRCRKRKMDFIRELQVKMAQLHEEHDDLREQREAYKNEACKLSADFKKYFSDTFKREEFQTDVCRKPDETDEENNLIKTMANFYQNEMLKLQQFNKSLTDIPRKNLKVFCDVGNNSSNDISNFSQCNNEEQSDILILCQESRKNTSESQELF